jgi:general secretion pathway protein C
MDDHGEESAEASIRDMVDDYREVLEENPEQAMDALGVSPVAEGAAEGYRIGDLAHSPYLSQTGLQPGDVILSVNGRPVGDLNQDRQELSNVLAQGSARLEVQRGSRRFFVTASLQ